MASDVMASRVTSLPVAVTLLWMAQSVFVVCGQNTSHTSSVAPDAGESKDKFDFLNRIWFWPAVAGVGVLSLCICVTGCCIRRRRIRRNQQDDAAKMGSVGHHEDGPYDPPADDNGSTESSVLSLFDPISPDISIRITPYQNPNSDIAELRESLKTIDMKELAYEQIQTLERLDMSGPFRGEIRRGFLFPVDKAGELSAAEQVVIKSLSDDAVPGAGRDMLVSLMREIFIMAQFKHKNIVRLIGVVSKDVPPPGHPLAVYEHMHHGPLDRYLRKVKPDLKTQLAMTADIVAGVEYLARRLYTFGNLSTKLVLVGHDKVLRIGHFVDATPIVIDPSEPLPKPTLSWTAPELFRDCDINGVPRWRISGDSGLASKSMASTDEERRKISPAADVWALGVVLWEVFTNAEVAPFHKYPTTKIAGIVRNGHRPPVPQGCPRDIYKLMMDCWHPEPAKRPTATEVRAALPHKVPRASSETSTTYPDLTGMYLSTSGRHASNDSEQSIDTQHPNALVHKAVSGLKVPATMQGTLSSRPSNYTSGTGSTRSQLSMALDADADRVRRGTGGRDLRENMPPGTLAAPRFVEVFERPRLASSDEDMLATPLPPTLLRASTHLPPDAYLTILPHEQEQDGDEVFLSRPGSLHEPHSALPITTTSPGSPTPGVSLVRRASERGRRPEGGGAPFQRGKSLSEANRGKSAMALAMEGIVKTPAHGMGNAGAHMLPHIARAATEEGIVDWSTGGAAQWKGTRTVAGTSPLKGRGSSIPSSRTARTWTRASSSKAGPIETPKLLSYQHQKLETSWSSPASPSSHTQSHTPAFNRWEPGSRSTPGTPHSGGSAIDLSAAGSQTGRRPFANMPGHAGSLGSHMSIDKSVVHPVEDGLVSKHVPVRDVIRRMDASSPASALASLRHFHRRSAHKSGYAHPTADEDDDDDDDDDDEMEDGDGEGESGDGDSDLDDVDASTTGASAATTATSAEPSMARPTPPTAATGSATATPAAASSGNRAVRAREEDNGEEQRDAKRPRSSVAPTTPVVAAAAPVVPDANPAVTVAAATAVTAATNSPARTNLARRSVLDKATKEEIRADITKYMKQKGLNGITLVQLYKKLKKKDYMKTKKEQSMEFLTVVMPELSTRKKIEGEDRYILKKL
eukprot:m.888693 g.888693  ORF g.888693 m.888693 type:complete len:1144 (-) comp23639_c1_seq5:1705-5136(-)